MRHIIPFLLFVAALTASDIVFYDTASVPTNRVTRFAQSIDETPYIGKAGALIITNLATQKGTGVTMSNLTLVCIVDGQTVRLPTLQETKSYTNWVYTNELAMAARVKYDARAWGTNVVNGSGAIELFLRAKMEADWFYINQIRTNLAKPALTKQQYLDTVNGYIDSFGQ